MTFWCILSASEVGDPYLKERVSSVEFKHDAAYAPYITRVAPAQF